MSALYNKMHEVFPALKLGQLNPHQNLITAVLDALPADASFETMQDLLTEKYIDQLPEEIGRTVPVDFFKSVVDRRNGRQTVDKSYINQLMCFSGNETPKDYIEALLRLCAPIFETVSRALSHGDDVERSLVTFFNRHAGKSEFN